MENKSVVFCFTECNPPSLAHILMFSLVMHHAQKIGADYYIIVGQNQDKNKNPLSLAQKIEYLKLQLPKEKITSAQVLNNPSDILKYLKSKYENVSIVCGSDQVDYYKKFNIQTISTGELAPDSDRISNKSSLKMIQYAKDGNYKKFKECVMPSVREMDSKRMMNDIRVGCALSKIKESIILHTSDIREKYRAGEIFAEGSFVVENSNVYKIINRNNNYLTIVNEDGIISKKWLTDVKEFTPNDEILNKFREITEMKFSSSDKIKVAKIIGGMLGADVEKTNNPEQIVNSGLKIAKSKSLNAEAISILKKMLQTASDAGIDYDKTLVPNIVTKNEAEEVARADFKVGLSGRKSRRKISFDTEEKPKTPSVDESTEIKHKVEISHIQGKRFLADTEAEQVEADRHHASLNQLGGRQVHIPTGATIGAPADSSIGREKIIKRIRGESVEHDDDFEISDEDVDNMVDSFKDVSDILDAYDDSELHLIDAESGESYGSLDKIKDPKAAVDEVPDAEKDDTKYAKDMKIESAINEVLTREDRIKAAIRMRIHHVGMERKIHLALQRHSTSGVIARRARKLAEKAIKIKIMHKPLSQFSISDKERVERIMQRRKAIVARVALKLIPKVRAIERQRLSHPGFTKE